MNPINLVIVRKRMGKWHCFLPVVLSILSLSCCHVPISVSNTNVQIKKLLDLVELDPRVVSRWSAIEPLVQQHGITSPPSRSDWLNLIFESNKRTYKSRAILTAGARNWDSKYTRDLFERSDIAKLDAFARLQLVGLMAKKMLDAAPSCSNALSRQAAFDQRLGDGLGPVATEFLVKRLAS